jgi:hypothetical protein
MIKNITKNTIIAKNYNICKTIFQKARGLMLKRHIVPSLFIFNKEQIISLHMFFVFSTIDVLFLSKNLEIVEIKQNFKPFTLYTPKNI